MDQNSQYKDFWFPPTSHRTRPVYIFSHARHIFMKKRYIAHWIIDHELHDINWFVGHELHAHWIVGHKLHDIKWFAHLNSLY